jgi:hypothetical protein
MVSHVEIGHYFLLHQAASAGVVCPLACQGLLHIIALQQLLCWPCLHSKTTRKTCCCCFLPSAPSITPLPTVNLKSDTGAESISHWLQQHAVQLQELELSTVGLYSRHIHPPTRLRLFQALHAAAGSTAAEHLGDAAAAAAGAGRGAANAGISSEEEEEPDNEQQQQQDVVAPQGSCGQLEQPPTAADAAAAAAGDPAGIAAAAAAAGTAMQHDASHHHHHQQQQTQIKPLRLIHLAVNARLAIPDCAAIASLPAPHLASLALLGSRTRRLGFDGVGSLAQLRQLTSLKVRLDQ